MKEMKNPIKVFSLQANLFTSFIIISAILILTLGITSYMITNQEVVDKTISSRILLLDEINKQIDIQLQAVEYDSLVAASHPLIVEYLQEEENSFSRIEKNEQVIDLLSRQSYIKEGIHSVQLYAKGSSNNYYSGVNGIFAYSILEQSPMYDMIQHADYIWLGTNKLINGSFVQRKDDVVSFSRKVLSPEGKELGVLVFNVNISYMHKLMSSHAADAGRFLLDTNSRLILDSSQVKNDALPYSAISEALPDLMNQGNFQKQYAIHHFDEKQLLVWSKQQRTQWVSLDLISWTSITAGSQKIKNTIVIVAIICVVLAITFAYFLARQFVHPIKGLVNAMKHLKTGRLNTRIDNEYDNEFGYLNNHFNNMAINIEELIEQLNRKNQQKREADIKVLQEQMNPHFIYNTLDVMNWHAIEAGAGEISRMLSLLGKMLRIALSSGESFIPIRKEVEHITCYVELQKIRYQDQIHILLHIPETINDYYLPKLTLQPFVENAIIHGFHSRRKGFIAIRALELTDSIVFIIEDNGHGMEDTAKVREQQHHGVSNVSDRIDLYFGSAYGVNIESILDKGTTVTISVPKLSSVPGDWERLREGHDGHERKD